MSALDLTEDGRRFAESNAADSIVARIAMEGSASGWPGHYVTEAIQACNRLGERGDGSA